MQNRPKTATSVKVSISGKVHGILKIFRVQQKALIVRRPKDPRLACYYTILHGEKYSRLVPGNFNLEHHTRYSEPHVSTVALRIYIIFHIIKQKLDTERY